MLSGLTTFSQLDVERTLAEVVAVPEHLVPDLERTRSAAALANSENAPYVLPKLALLLGAMRHSRIGEVTFMPTNGNWFVKHVTTARAAHIIRIRGS